MPGAVLGTLLLLTLLLSAAGCGEKTVSVKTGERVVCTYGEEVTSSVRTIEVPADEAGKHAVRTTRVTCDRHTQLEKLYAEAQTAIGAGDLKTATEKLTQVVAADSGFRSAAGQLEDIRGGRAPRAGTGTSGSSATTSTGGGTTGSGAPGTSKPGGSKPGDSGAPEGPVASLLVYTPDDLAGYRADRPAADVFSITRQYVAREPGPVVALVIQVEQHRSDAAARKWLADNVVAKYTKSARNVRIDGRETYLGTDGRRFAIAGWTEGPVSVAIEAEAASAPGDAIPVLQKIAAQIPR